MIEKIKLIYSIYHVLMTTNHITTTALFMQTRKVMRDDNDESKNRMFIEKWEVKFHFYFFSLKIYIQTTMIICTKSFHIIIQNEF